MTKEEYFQVKDGKCLIPDVGLVEVRGIWEEKFIKGSLRTIFYIVDYFNPNTGRFGSYRVKVN